MERLTDKNSTFDEEKTKEMFKQRDEYVLRSGKIENKLREYENLEEEIGCPIEIFLKLALKEINEIYVEYDDGWDNGLYQANVDNIYDKSSMWSDKSDWTIETNITEFKVNDYKKTWWLKEDKSE